MNPDVPSLEACRRLGEAGWPQEDSDYAWVATSGSQETGGWYVCQGASKHFRNKRMAVAAPTIGELLTEIRRRRYSLKHAIAVALLNQIRARLDAPLKDCFETLLICMTADDLANALSEALEKEKP